MKKIILLALIVLIVPIVIIEDTNKDFNYHNDNYPDLQKDEKWEYVKERVFNGYNEKVYKYNGPILFELYNATEKDSLVVNSILDELKVLLPNKELNYFKDYTGLALDDSFQSKDRDINYYKLSDLKKATIKLYFEENDDANLFSNIPYSFKIYNKEWTFYSAKKISGFVQPDLHYVFSGKSTLKQRKIEIQRDFIWTIACAQFFQNKKDKTVNSRNSILDNKESIRMGSQFSELDKFLLQKLYSPNLKKEFKAYMYKTYPWSYASIYINKEKTKVFAIWTSIMLGVILFVLGFSLFYRRKYKHLYYSYFVPVLYFMISILYVFKIFTYMTKPYEFEHWRQYISIHVVFIIVALLIALFLMLFDKFIIKNSMSFTLQIAFKTVFTFFVCIAPVAAIFFLENNRNTSWFNLNPFLLLVFTFAASRGLLLYLENFSDSLLKQKDVELSRLKEVSAKAEVKLLQSQINPHFLYNALNSIATLVYKNADKTEQMALSLSDLFKYSINKKGDKMSTVADEVDMVKNYLDIEQIRFGDRLQFSIQVDKAVESVKIPMFIIQPLVENAVKHGISKIGKDGMVTLKINNSDIGLDIIVEDNGPHFPEGVVSGHGLQTVFDLLRLTYGERASLSWKNAPVKHIKITIKKIAL
ncbi:histidine kinase [Sabulilitoribacter arenilitoris]|uniref:Histidine kinase n=1 Tax=Wocania arenilitoris TaxID=2044858 RepID=A0AAE3ELV1_9FLAO|nr:histidine kinase [Wocania arenilitoris]MCF7567252.1 histidine kinase [Wocania arenilitoris]